MDTKNGKLILSCMARHDELPVYKATYDLMLSVFRFVKDFTKEYKYSVGDTLNLRWPRRPVREPGGLRLAVEQLGGGGPARPLPRRLARSLRGRLVRTGRRQRRSVFRRHRVATAIPLRRGVFPNRLQRPPGRRPQLRRVLRVGRRGGALLVHGPHRPASLVLPPRTRQPRGRWWLDESRDGRVNSLLEGLT